MPGSGLPSSPWISQPRPQPQEVSNHLPRPAGDSPRAKDRVGKCGQTDGQTQGSCPPSLGRSTVWQPQGDQEPPPASPRSKEMDRGTEEGLASAHCVQHPLEPLSQPGLEVGIPGITGISLTPHIWEV